MTCSLGLQFRDAVTCGEIRSDGTCHNHAVVAGLRKHGEDADRLQAEVARLTEQLRIAEDALNMMARCGCPTCGPGPSTLAQARTMADDALTRMSVVE